MAGILGACASALATNPIDPEDRVFLEDLQHRCFRYFWEQTNQQTGLTPDRSGLNGGPPVGPSIDIGSSAATGFGLTALCIGANNKWITKEEARARACLTLDFFANHAFQERGWFLHWMDTKTGERRWNSEVSSIDTALLVAGVLTAGQYFQDDPEIRKLAKLIYDRIDFRWMLDNDAFLLSHGWRPDKGFIKYRWNTYAEMSILYLMGIGSSTYPLSPDSWYAFARPLYNYGTFHFVSGGPLFTHQYSHAWVDFRNRRDREFIDYFQNSVEATRANHLYCSNLAKTFPLSFGSDIWGITASDSPRGYKIYGEIQHLAPIDGTVAPCAAGGSLMFAPDICIPTLRSMQGKFEKRVWGRYGFVDGFNPQLNWFDTDVIGIDVGITLMSAENLLTGNVWRWFMQNQAIPKAMNLVDFEPPVPEPGQAPPKPLRRHKPVRTASHG